MLAACDLMRPAAIEQLAVLGRATRAIEQSMQALESRPPGAVAARIDFSERIAHRIEPRLFYRLIYAGMLLTGIKLVWDAWG